MGALTRYRAYLLNQFRMKVRSYKSWAHQQPTDMLAIHPGLTVGATVMGMPASDGETYGEFYLSNDTTPPYLFVWTNDGWYLISTIKATPLA